MVLLIGPTWRPSDRDISTLEEMGHELYLLTDERAPLPVPYERVEGVVCNNLFLFHKVEKFTSLRYVQLTSAGMDRAPVEYFRAHGITLNNARGVYSIPMAEHTLLSVLALYRRFDRFVNNKAQHRYEKVRDARELCGRCVLTVGCGSVGRTVGEKFAAMGCELIGVDDYAAKDGVYKKIYPTGELDDALALADVVILALPYTEKTRHIINAERLARLHPEAVLVNISRGGTLDTAALVDALRAGRIYGAVLDVFEEEPLPEDSPLWDVENLIITPHNSFVGDGNAKRLSALILENLSKD